MNQNDKNDPQKSSHKPIGPSHTYEDKPGQTRSTPDTNRPSASPGKTSSTQPGEPHTPEPGQPLPDYGDTEPGDPRRLTTTGGDTGGAQPGGAQDVGGGGASSTLQG